MKEQCSHSNFEIIIDKKQFNFSHNNEHDKKNNVHCKFDLCQKKLQEYDLISLYHLNLYGQCQRTFVINLIDLWNCYILTLPILFQSPHAKVLRIENDR